MLLKHYIICGIAVLLGFAGGFLLANALNRSGMDRLDSGLKSSSGQGKTTEKPGNLDLAESEIREKLSQAANDPENFPLQKGLGLALYQFAALKQDEKRLDDVEVLLQRAYALNPDDYEVLVAFGSINIDLAKIQKDPLKIKKARGIFAKALEKNPKDVRVLNTLASTYLAGDDPDPDRAIIYLNDAMSADKRNEAALLNLASAYLAKGNTAKAREYVSKLKELNRSNPEIIRIEGKIQMEEAR